MVAYADLILPDTTYLERWDCISLLDRPISGADAPADAIRQPVVEPDRDVRAVPDRAARSRRAAEVAGLRHRQRRAALSRRLSGLHRQPRAQPGHRLAGGLSRRGRQELRPRRAQSEAARRPTSPTAASTSIILRRSSATTSTPTRPIWIGPRTWASSAPPRRSSFQLYLEPLQKFRLAARGHGAVTAAGDAPRADRKIFRSDPVLVSAVRRRSERRRISVLGHHAAADAHVSLVGLAQRLAPPDHGGELAST